MTLSIKHTFQSLKGDGVDPTQIQPSHWNAALTALMASGKVLGRTTVGTGAVEEIDWTAFGRSILNAADAAAVKTLIGSISDHADGSVALADLANLATGYVIGRKTAGTGVPEALTALEVLDQIAASARGDILVRGVSNWGRTAKGSAGQVLRSDGTDTAFGVYAPLLHLREEQTSGTASQTTPTSNGTWNKRLLNTTKTNEITGASIASSVITLPAGTYEVSGGAVCILSANGGSGTCKARLRDTVNSVTLLVGPNSLTSTVATGGTGETHFAPVSGRLTLASTTTFELQAWSTTSGAVSAGTTGEVEVYADLMIRRVG